MKSRRLTAFPRWRLFTEQCLGMFLCLLAAATFGLGLCGFSVQYAALPKSPEAGADWTIPVYKTFQLFLLNSGTEDDPSHPGKGYHWDAERLPPRGRYSLAFQNREKTQRIRRSAIVVG